MLTHIFFPVALLAASAAAASSFSTFVTRAPTPLPQWTTIELDSPTVTTYEPTWTPTLNSTYTTRSGFPSTTPRPSSSPNSEESWTTVKEGDPNHPHLYVSCHQEAPNEPGFYQSVEIAIYQRFPDGVVSRGRLRSCAFQGLTDAIEKARAQAEEKCLENKPVYADCDFEDLVVFSRHITDSKCTLKNGTWFCV